MIIEIEINENELKKLILRELEDKMGSIPIAEKLVKIEVKSKQNCEAEWESAAFRATYRQDTSLPIL